MAKKIGAPAPTPQAPRKAPDAVDKHIGGRIRLRRLMLKMSQTDLGDGLNLTFQQVQKYEKGANRVGGSRMQQIATILGVPVSFFYEGSPGSNVTPEKGSNAVPDFIHPVTSTSDGLALIKAFGTIRNSALRRQIVGIVETIASLAPPND